MRRLERLDLLLIASLVPLWLVTLGLHLRAIAATGLARVSVFVGPPQADGYPTVRGHFVQHGELADVQELRIGDRLLAAGGVDLRGMGHLGFHALVLELGSHDLSVPIRFEREGRSGEALLTLVRPRYPWGLVPSLVISGIAGLIILVRAQSPRQGRRFFLPLMLYLALAANFEGGPRAFSYAWRGFQFLAGTVVPPLVVLWGLDFTQDSPRRGWLARGWPWLLAPVYAVLRLSYVFGGPVPPAYVSAALGATDAAAAVALLGALTWNYRRSDAEGRRRIKWVLYGFYLGLVPFVVVSNLAPVPRLMAWQNAIYGISMVLTVACILGILVAIVWHHLWDIDRIISGTASYTIVGVLALTCLLTVVPRLAQATSSVVPVAPELGQTAFSVLLAAVAVATNRKLRPWMDQVFFPERQALERGLGQLLQEFSACESPQTLFALAGERLEALLRPESCVLYVEEGRAYTPAFARGRAIPAAFATGGSLVGALGHAREPIRAERWSLARGSPELDALDRAALQTLAPSIVGPVRRGKRLVAFVCLGRKQSGDIYSESDRALIGVVCQRLGGELVRFEETEVLERTTRIYTQLRRYVPGAVAERLERGETLTPSERELSVLFVDIRGYSSFAEPRHAPDIFSTVNRYTELVSSVVRKHSGSVVEFNGDGMMAIFGAPERLASKERSAVSAAREIVPEVARIPIDGVGGAPLRVGVGIATGPAFVGSIHSADRLIWTAIGNTVNLASRLQALTRQLEVAILVDATTWERASELAADFALHRDQQIRGRSQRENLYSLRLEGAGAEPVS